MEALSLRSSSSSARVLSVGDTGFACPILSKPEICFLRLPKHAYVSFSLSYYRQHRTIHPFFSSPSLSTSHAKTDLEGEEIQIKDIGQLKNVHVKFQLQRECSFGQQFLLVGDDPIFGLWDPLNAVPLNWSDGHVWTVELDIPIEKSIKFKFILKGGTEEILWQPGPDRILQTRETEKTLTVCEDWDNAELQKIVEEEPTFDQTEELAIDSEISIFADNLTQPISLTDVEMESNTINSLTNPAEKPLAENPAPIIAENISDPNEKSLGHTEDAVPFFNNVATTGEDIFGDNGRALSVENRGGMKNEGELGSSEGVPLLVPGLTPLPTAQIEEASQNEGKNNVFINASLGTDEVMDHLNVLEFESTEESSGNSLHVNETSEIMLNETQELHCIEQVETSDLVKEPDQHRTNPSESTPLENDIQWGRRTLQKLLSNLGLL